MSSIKTAFGLAATAALLAVAAVTPSEAFTRHEQMWSSYDPTEINGAHGGRMLPTLVTGNPFGGSQEAFAEAVVGAMRGSRGGRPTDPAVAATATPPAQPTAIRPAHAPSDTGRDIIIAIDAGHGGVDPGASGKRGTREKDVVLEIARVLAARINREPGMKAVLTRDGDYFISLRERNLRARRAKARVLGPAQRAP